MASRTHTKIHVISRTRNNMAITEEEVLKVHQVNQDKEETNGAKWVTCLSSNTPSKCSSSKPRATSVFLKSTCPGSTPSRARTERTLSVTASTQPSKPSMEIRLPESSPVCFSTREPLIKESSYQTTPSSSIRSKRLIISTHLTFSKAHSSQLNSEESSISEWSS